jgi:hypothetical protein
MAQTKTKAKTKTKSRAKPKGKGKAAARSRQNAKGRAAAAKRNAEPTALKKLSGPTTAAGAAMLAVAGGLAASHRRNGRLRKIRKSLKGVELPSADTALDWVEDKATTFGDAGYRVAKLSSQARNVKKSVSGK